MLLLQATPRHGLGANTCQKSFPVADKMSSIVQKKKFPCLLTLFPTADIVDDSHKVNLFFKEGEYRRAYSQGSGSPRVFLSWILTTMGLTSRTMTGGWHAVGPLNIVLTVPCYKHAISQISKESNDIFPISIFW